jgi:hypothetical protein
MGTRSGGLKGASRSPTPPRSGITTPPVESFRDDAINRNVNMKKQIDQEFPNRVITQIYNYLSLGYPSLARPFDDELSKISGIPVEELRGDDFLAENNPKDYVGVPEGDGAGMEDAQGAVPGCRRWEAPKFYVRTWARESPSFADRRPRRTGKMGLKGKEMEMWGASARKGSWAC